MLDTIKEEMPAWRSIRMDQTNKSSIRKRMVEGFQTSGQYEPDNNLKKDPVMRSIKSTTPPPPPINNILDLP
jgi:hypothetical protein